MEQLLKRAFMFLEEGEWERADEYCEKVLDQDPECAEAYLGKLMVEYKIRVRSDFNSLSKFIEENNNYKKAIRFADDALNAELTGYVQNIKTSAYNFAVREMERSSHRADYLDLARFLQKLKGFKDADELAERCMKLSCEVLNADIKQLVNWACISEYGEEIEKNLTKDLEELKNQKKKILVENDSIDHAPELIKKYKENISNYQNSICSLEKEVSSLGVFAGSKKRELNEKISEERSKLIVEEKNLNNLNQMVAGGKKSEEEITKKIEELEYRVQDLEMYKNMDIRPLQRLLDDQEALSIIQRNINILDPLLCCKAIPERIRERLTFKFGVYPQTIEGSDETPIEWKILYKGKGEGEIPPHVLIVSKYVLDVQQYDTSNKCPVTWEQSSLRKWMNETFLNKAFSSEEKAKMIYASFSGTDIYTEIDDSDASDYDKVFLLNAYAIAGFFPTEDDKRCEFTEYAQRNGESEEWWLRSTVEMQRTYLFDNKRNLKEGFVPKAENVTFGVAEMVNSASPELAQFFPEGLPDDFIGHTEPDQYKGVRPALCIALK